MNLQPYASSISILMPPGRKVRSLTLQKTEVGRSKGPGTSTPLHTMTFFVWSSFYYFCMNIGPLELWETSIHSLYVWYISLNVTLLTICTLRMQRAWCWLYLSWASAISNTVNGYSSGEPIFSSKRIQKLKDLNFLITMQTPGDLSS